MKHLRRAVWFLAGRLLVLCLVIGIVVTVFYYAMNLSNIQVILKDGMANRAKFIMGMTDDQSELNRYFHSAYPATDSALVSAANGNSPYKDYNVRGIDHRLEMGFLWVWPWDNSVRLSAREFEVMRLLMTSGGNHLSKETLLTKVWGYESNAVENHVEVYVGFLRKKLTSIGSDIRIEAVRRLGYHLECDE